MMLSLVLLGVGSRRTPQQRNPQHVSEAREAVLALGKDGHTIPKLAEIGEFVPANLKLGHVPGGVLVRGALEVTELGFVGGVVAVNVQGQFD